MQHIELGKKGESVAKEYLLKKGFVFLAMNWRPVDGWDGGVFPIKDDINSKTFEWEWNEGWEVVDDFVVDVILNVETHPTAPLTCSLFMNEWVSRDGYEIGMRYIPRFLKGQYLERYISCWDVLEEWF